MPLPSSSYLTAHELDVLEDLILGMAQKASESGKIEESYGHLEAKVAITQARKICSEKRKNTSPHN